MKKAPGRTGEAGTALVVALLAMIVIGLLSASIWMVTARGSESMVGREDHFRALQLAEAGTAHAMALQQGPLSGYSFDRLLRGWDDTEDTDDDGILDGYGMDADIVIPDTGRVMSGGRYFVQVLDDPADPNASPWVDENMRVALRCRGVTDQGAVSEIDVIVTASMAAFPGVAADDDLEISGKLIINGDCGGAHVNGSFTGGGEPTAETQWSATGSIPSKFNGTKVPGAEPMDIPDLEAITFMGANCDYTYTGDWKFKGSTPEGTHCVFGNVESEGDFGNWNTKKTLSIIATGAIEIGSKPFIRAAHPDGILLMAAGDLSLQGDWGGEGLLYAGGHCYVSSKPRINGQLICKGKADPPGAEDHTDQNLISGDAEITFECDSMLSGGEQRIVAWYQRIGS